jgi:hypothetical protein
MDVTEFRRSLAAFAGSERFRKLVRDFNREGRWLGRLRFWQEDLLDQFAASFNVVDVTFERVESLLRMCELHQLELVPDLEGLSQRCRGAVNEYTIAAAEHFPNTDCGPLEFGNRFENFRTGLWYCPACREAEARWKPITTQSGATRGHTGV